MVGSRDGSSLHQIIQNKESKHEISCKFADSLIGFLFKHLEKVIEPDISEAR